VLLRGHNASDHAKYWSLFEGEETKTQACWLNCVGAKAANQQPSTACWPELRTLGQRYRAAVAKFEPAENPLSYRDVDSRVRGMDRPPTDEMSALVERLQARMAGLGRQNDSVAPG